MNHPARKAPILFFTFLIALSLACSSITIAIDSAPPTPHPVLQTRQIGFDFSGQVPSSPKGDTSARRHLFLHEYPMPSDGFINGIMYLNDSDKAVEQFDLLILRPNDDGWKIIYRINVTDDSPPAQTGTTVVQLPAPLVVQKNDTFAHWQDTPNGAIPLNIDNESIDGFSEGQYGFQSSEVEVGQQIDINGFIGQRDYFINLVFSTGL
ncbi:MAG TPA: hypothetical protein PLA27_00125 [Anaerolineales bacterium]|jgi:hypothetical protein|nr:hypothetical protein [Anaerolineales bacterium]HQX14795.1 hypothetical protein [Anaerolineales bacterium]